MMHVCYMISFTIVMIAWCVVLVLNVWTAMSNSSRPNGSLGHSKDFELNVRVDTSRSIHSLQLAAFKIRNYNAIAQVHVSVLVGTF
jgi:hypothetical protein